MTIKELRKAVSNIKKTVKPENETAILVSTTGEPYDENSNIRIESIIAINGYSISGVSKEEIASIIDKDNTENKVIYILPDNERDPGIWQPWNPRVF